MNTEHDVTRLLEALKWHEYQAKQAALAVVSRNGDAVVKIIALLAADVGQRGMRARALYGDDSDAGAGG